MCDLDAAWEEFMTSGTIENLVDNKESKNLGTVAPDATEIYISTKTRIVFLNNPVDLYECFWKINIMRYDTEDSGVIKKQIKIISNTPDELSEVQAKLDMYPYYTQQVISHLDQHQGKSQVYKDVRKVSVGVCHKDLLSFRSKQKGAFYNCFVVIIRLLDETKDEFKEVHAKIFNTGKVEIPGIQNEEMFNKTITFIEDMMTDITTDIHYKMMENKTETILINSNFHCGFCINRQQLFEILRADYNMNVSYDPCSYPGIQCKYHIEGYKVSFMIFRTGSVLIVGKCEDHIIQKVYEKLKSILSSEYSKIYEHYDIPVKPKEKTMKPRKKIIYV